MTTEDSAEGRSDCDCESALFRAGASIAKSKSGHILRIAFPGRDNPLPADALNALAQCLRLRELSLARIPLGDEIAEFLTPLTRLVSLDLESTGVGDECLRALRHHRRLELLNVRNTAVTAELIAQARKSMIRTRIVGP